MDAPKGEALDLTVAAAKGQVTEGDDEIEVGLLNVLFIYLFIYLFFFIYLFI